MERCSLRLAQAEEMRMRIPGIRGLRRSRGILRIGCAGGPMIRISLCGSLPNGWKLGGQHGHLNAQSPLRNSGTRTPSVVSPSISSSAEPIMKSTCVKLTLAP